MRTTRRLRTGGLALLLAAALPSTPARAASTIFKCVDGNPQSLTVIGVPQPDPTQMVCDGDGARNGSCTFLAMCPLCAEATPPCRIACFDTPRYEWSVAPVGHARAVRVGHRTFLFRCDRPRHLPRH